MAEQSGNDQTGEDQLPSHLLALPTQLGEDVEELVDYDDDTGEGGEGGQGNDDIETLRAQVQHLQEENKQNTEHFQNLVLQLAAAPGGGGQQQAPAPDPNQQTPGAGQGPDFSDLPDPVENKDEFNKQLGQRINQYISQQQQTQHTQANAQSQQQQVLSDLDNRFRQQYAELADKELLFKTAAEAEASKLRGMGLDPMKAAQMQPDKLLKDIADRMYGELGAEPGSLAGDDGEGGNVAQGRQTKQQQQRNNRGGRTAGVSGGSRPGGNRGSGDGKKQQKSKGFIQDIKDTQLQEGLI